MDILFFGDSNTWGYNPLTGGRYPYEQRWTTVAAKALGEEYHCIAAGLNGRTTVFDDPYKPLRNGKQALETELHTHKPLDLAVCMLGTNDLKFVPATGAARGMETLAHMVLRANERNSILSPVFTGEPKLLIVSPVLVGEGIAKTPLWDLMENAAAESKRFAELYRAVADRTGAGFLDAALYAQAEEHDCLHMTREGHEALGLAVAAKVREMLSR